MTSAGRADSGIDFEHSMIPEPVLIEKNYEKIFWHLMELEFKKRSL